MLSLLPTPFWDTTTQTAMPGIEPKSLKIHSRENHFTPVIAKTRPKPRKNIINIKETSMNKIEEGTRTLNALYDTLISGNHLPNSETSISDY